VSCPQAIRGLFKGTLGFAADPKVARERFGGSSPAGFFACGDSPLRSVAEVVAGETDCKGRRNAQDISVEGIHFTEGHWDLAPRVCCTLLNRRSPDDGLPESYFGGRKPRGLSYVLEAIIIVVALSSAYTAFAMEARLRDALKIYNLNNCQPR
jgi:hypothetical protein